MSNLGTLGDLRVQDARKEGKGENHATASAPSPAVPPASRAKVLGRAKDLPSRDELAAIREARIGTVQAMIEDMTSLAALVIDDAQWQDYLTSMVGRFGEVKAFLDDLTPVEKQNAMAAYIKAGLENLPRNNMRSCIILGTAGVVIGFFREVDGDTKRIPAHRIVSLPVLDERTHRHHVMSLVSDHPRAGGLTDLIRGFEHDVKEQGRAEWREKIDAMKAGDTAKTLAECIREGNGQITLKAPDEEVGGRFYAGGWITIVIKASHAEIVDALGKCQRITIEQVVPAEVKILISAIEQSRIDLRTFPIEKRRAAIIAHGLLHRAFIAEATELREKAKKSKVPDPVVEAPTPQSAATVTTATAQETPTAEPTDKKPAKRIRKKKTAGDSSSTAESPAPIAADSATTE